MIIKSVDFFYNDPNQHQKCLNDSTRIKINDNEENEFMLYFSKAYFL